MADLGVTGYVTEASERDIDTSNGKGEMLWAHTRAGREKQCWEIVTRQFSDCQALSCTCADTINQPGP